MGTIPAAPALTVGSGGQGVLAGLIDDTAYLVWVRSVDIAGNRSDPAGPYQGRTSRFGQRDIGVLKREYIYRTHPTGQLRPQERARNNWNYDEPVAPWRDNAPSLTAEQPFLIRDERPVPVGVEVGDAVDGQWIGAAIIGHYGVDGASGDDGAPGDDGSGVEFIYALTATGLVGDDQLPDDNWRFDLPRVAGGLKWHDGAPSTTPARPFLMVASRRTQGFPQTGHPVTGEWGRPAVQSHYGDDGVSASVGAPVFWFRQADGSYEPAATTQDVDIRFYRGRREFASGTVHFQRVGNGLRHTTSTGTSAEVLGNFSGSVSKGKRDSRVLGITATWHGMDGDDTNNISITACAYIIGAGAEPSTRPLRFPPGNGFFSGNVGDANFSALLPAATGGDGAIGYSLNGALPPGLTRSGRQIYVVTAGQMREGSWDLVWKATDSDNPPNTAQINVTIRLQRSSTSVTLSVAPSVVTTVYDVSDGMWTTQTLSIRATVNSPPRQATYIVNVWNNADATPGLLLSGSVPASGVISRDFVYPGPVDEEVIDAVPFSLTWTAEIVVMSGQTEVASDTAQITQRLRSRP